MFDIHGIEQYYGGSHILRGVSLQVQAGEITVLLGRNGAGKTTLLRSIMGLIPVRQGQMRMQGKDITAAPTHARVREGLGYVPQGREIFARLSVEENLVMGLASQPAGSAIPEQIWRLFPVLQEMKHRRGGDLSGGQQQQLAIGRALCSRPKLLILDEPTEGIQPSIIKAIGNAIRLLAREQGLAILLVEQYFDFAQSLADHYLLMERGSIVASGKGQDLDAHGIRERLAV